MLRLLTRFAVAGAALPAAQAILVAPKSPCSSNCGNVLDSTSSADIVCIESQYNDGYNSGAGQIFQGCLKCELSSPFATGNNYTDSDAMLCMFAPSLSSNHHSKFPACAPTKPAQYRDLNAAVY